LPREVKKLADHIVDKVNDIPTLTGRNPSSLAASAIYLACELTDNSKLRTADEIGKTCGAAENTIKQTIKLMQPNLEKLVPAEYKAKLNLASGSK
jgi:transcription initiation factor TFIIIB Brf1 subunit/transcription initiation factor TFIIB